MSDYVLKISKNGEEVTTASTEDLLFDSNYSVLKIYKKGTTSFTTNGSGNATATIPHNLGYAPAFFVYRKATANWSLVSGATNYTNAFFPVGCVNKYVKDDDAHHAIHAYADSTNLYIQSSGGKASTAMYFTYIILVDRSQSFTGVGGVSTDQDYGLKIAKSGYDVLEDPEYLMSFSSKYKIVQYYDVSQKKNTLTFDRIFASMLDTYVEQASYIDFNHGLGYTPMFLAYATGTTSTGGYLAKIPLFSDNSIDIFNLNISGFADATRIRIYWWRSSIYLLGTLYDDWPAETLTVRVNVCTERLDV